MRASDRLRPTRCNYCLHSYVLPPTVVADPASSSSSCTRYQQVLRPPPTTITSSVPCGVSRKSRVNFDLSDPCVSRVSIVVCCQACDQIGYQQPDAGQHGLELVPEADGCGQTLPCRLRMQEMMLFFGPVQYCGDGDELVPSYIKAQH